MIAEIVDAKALLTVIYTSLVAGIGVCAAYALVLVGLARSTEHRKANARTRAALYTMLATLAAVVCVGAIVGGVVIVATQ